MHLVILKFLSRILVFKIRDFERLKLLIYTLLDKIILPGGLIYEICCFITFFDINFFFSR
jgi:hypothetical protein